MFSMIDKNYASAGPAVELPQLQGPWSIARGNEPAMPTWLRASITLASAVVSGYHGTRRNGGSIFWGVTWFGLGAVFPVVTPVVALAQGLGECKNNCSVGKTVHLSGRR